MATRTARAAAARFGWNDRPTRIAAAHLFTLLFLLVWAAAASRLPVFLLPGPLDVADSLWTFLTTPRLVRHMLASFWHVGVSIALSFVVGALLALIPYYWPVFRFAVHGRIGPFLNSFSGVGWTLLAVMWFGVGPTTVVFAIAAVLVPFALVNLSEGLAALDRETMEMGRSFTRSRLRRFVLIVVPALMPFVFATLRIMFGVSWKVTLTAELFGGNSGFGYVINLGRQEFDTPQILAVIVLIVAFVIAVDRLLFAPVQARLSRQYGNG